MRVIFLFSVLTLFLTGTSARSLLESANGDPGRIKEALQAQWDYISDSLDDGDVGAIMQQLASAVTIMAPGADVIEASEDMHNVRQTVRNWAAQLLHQEVKVQEAVGFKHGSANGVGYALEWDTFNASSRQNELVQSGKAVQLWKYERGKWRIFWTIWNEDINEHTLEMHNFTPVKKLKDEDEDDSAEQVLHNLAQAFSDGNGTKAAACLDDNVLILDPQAKPVRGLEEAKSHIDRVINRFGNATYTYKLDRAIHLNSKNSANANEEYTLIRGHVAIEAKVNSSLKTVHVLRRSHQANNDWRILWAITNAGPSVRENKVADAEVPEDTEQPEQDESHHGDDLVQVA